MDELREKVMNELDVLVAAARMGDNTPMDHANFEKTYSEVVNRLVHMIIVSVAPPLARSTVQPEEEDFHTAKESFIAP